MSFNDPALYIDDDGIISAGGAITFDLCLDLVRLDNGDAVANTIAR